MAPTRWVALRLWDEDGAPFGLSTAAIYADLARPFAEQSMAIGYVPARPEAPMVLTTGQKLADIPVIAVQPSAEFAKDLTTVIQKWRDTFG